MDSSLVDQATDAALGNPVVVVIVMVAVIAAFLSKKLAEIGGPLGSAARWWSRRQLRRLEVEREVTRAESAAYEQERSQQLVETDARLSTMAAQLLWMREDQARERAEARSREAALRTVLAEHRAWDILVLEKLESLGVTDMPAPPALHGV